MCGGKLLYTQVEFNTHEKSSILSGSLNEFPKVYLQLVSGTDLELLWNKLVRTHHYLGYNQLLGKGLKYMAFIHKHRKYSG